MEIKKNNIEYKRFLPWQDRDIFSKLIECYRQVFGSAPWYEWKRCVNCNTKWGILESKEISTHCHVPVVDFWLPEQVEKDILYEVTEEASCWVAFDGDDLIGFTWGYPITPDMLEKKLELSGVQKDIETYFGKLEYVAYQDELGVQEQWREKNIASELHQKRLDDFRKSQLKVGIVRTQTKEQSVLYDWYQKLGYVVISEYYDDDKRVILAKEL